MIPVPVTPLDKLRNALTQYPRTLDELAAATEMSRRSVEQGIQALRLAGEPVVTDDRGARITHDPAEIEACEDSLQRRIVTQYQTLRGLRKSRRELARRLSGDPVLWSDL